ncbi:hypothetical protein RLOC_00000602 [Lonchura striata]|uniref:Uncharacterized protein n=1 Tax=Lonchura striata TaxID=40157 RepID=A0A218VAF6_9PASE|nr:hypothetical protein RLOC_00000602 [Lonchura striata domestica]
MNNDTHFTRKVKISCLKYIILGAHLLKKKKNYISFKISQAVSAEFIQMPKGFRI